MAASMKPKADHNFDKKTSKRRISGLDSKNDSGPEAKQKKNESMTEVEFKFLLRDPKTFLSGFEKFLTAADSLSENGNYDIVEGYCSSSPEATEILALLETENRKQQELHLIFSCLEKILLRIADDLSKFYSTGQHIVKKLMSAHINSIYFSLRMSNKSFQIKTSIKMLIAMVMMGSSTTKLVLTSLDFNHNNFKPLFGRRDTKDEEDIRTCVQHLMIAFLLSGDNEVIRRLADSKGVLEMVIQGIVYDRVPTIQLVLSTLLEKIVRNTGVSKTTKVHVFTDATLKQLGQLFRWQGPSKWKGSLHTKHTKSTRPNAEEMEDDVGDEDSQTMVAQIGHQFLVDLCSSYSHGIVFMDKTYGLSGRNQNHLLMSLMSSLLPLTTKPLVQDLITQILVACPDQLQFYIPLLVHSLAPRPSTKWVESVAFLHKIYAALPNDPYILRSNTPKSVPDIVKVLLMYTMPPTQILQTLLPGLKNKSLAVNHVTLSVVKVMTERATASLTSLDVAMTTGPLHTVLTGEEKTDLVNLYRETVVKTLPEALTIFQCWDKLTMAEKDTTEVLQLHDMCGASISDVQVRLEQVLCLYQELVPSLLLDHPVGLGKLLDGIISLGQGDLSATTSDDVTYLPQMYLLKLLSGTDARRLPWGKQNPAGHSLLYQLLEMVTHAAQREQIRDVSLDLICKLLEGTGLFDLCHEELLVWMKNLGNFKTDALSQVLSFVAKVMMTYINHPYPYMDRVCDLVSEVAVMETGSEVMKDVEMSDKKMKAVLSMDLSNIEEDMGDNNTHTSVVTPTHKRFPFCPVILVAVDTIQKMENVHQGIDVSTYLSCVLLETFHLQVDPRPFCLMIKSYHGHILHAYTNMWLTHTKPIEGQDPKTLFENGRTVTEGICKDLMKTLYGDREVTTQPCDVIQQYLLHLTYLLQHQPMKHCDTYMKGIRHVILELDTTIEAGIDDLVVQEMETEPSNTEFALLNLQKTDKSSVLVNLIRLILNHPQIRKHFLQERSCNQSNKIGNSITEVLTELVILLLDIVRQNQLDIGECFDFYHMKVLTSLKTLASSDTSSRYAIQMSGSILTSMQYIVDTLPAEKCIDVMDSVLTIVKVETDAKRICNVTDTIMKKLNASSIKMISFSENSVDNLIDCYLRRSDDMSPCLVEFFTKFPNISILCSENMLQSLIESDCYGKILEVLLSMNPVLRDVFGRMILDGDDRIQLKRHTALFVTYIKLVVQQETRSSGSAEVLTKIGEIYKDKMLELCGTEKIKHSAQPVQIMKTLLCRRVIGKKLVSKLEKRLMETLDTGENIRPYHFEILETLVGCQATSVSSQDRQRLLQTCLKGLTRLLSNKSKRNENVENTILEILSGYSKDEIEIVAATWSDFTTVWPQFVSGTLKCLYTDKRLLTLMIKLVPVVYSDSDTDVTVTIETLVTMVTSHSSFLLVMLNQEKPECKDHLLDLLSLLVDLCPASCVTDHLGVYFGGYGATLSLTDQKILRLLQVYEKNGVNFTEYKPYLWGEKAIEHHSMRKTLGPSLQSPSMQQILANLDPAKMQETILNFPLRRKLQDMEPQDAVNFRSSSDCYDPCFILPLLSHLLAPDAVVDCRKFVELDCLGLTLAALASHDQCIRSAAYHILDRYQVHLEGARFQEKEEIVYLMMFLRNSLPNPTYKLASIVTLFLVRAVKLMLHPDDHMYGIINSFLLLKPSLDVLNIPEFYKLFNSSAHEYKIERGWILSLMHDGLRETTDYMIFKKRFTFKLLQSFYDSETADTDCQLKVLQILKRACKEKTVAMHLARNQGIMIWIAAAVAKLMPDKVKHVSELTQLVHATWFSLLRQGDNSSGTKGDNSTPQPAFTGQVMSVLQTLLWHMRDVSAETLLQHLKTLMSVISHVDLILGASHNTIISTVPSISHVYILILLLHCGKYVQSKTAAQSIVSLLKSQGYDTSLLVQTKGAHSKRKPAFQNQEDRVTELDSNVDKPQSKEKSSLNEVEKDNTEENNKTVLELRKSLVQIIITWKPNGCGTDTDNMLTTNLMVMSWLTSQLEFEALDCYMGDILQVIQNFACQNHGNSSHMLIKGSNGALLEPSCLSTEEMAKSIEMDLLNGYCRVLSSHLGKESYRKDKERVVDVDKALSCLNNILLPLALHRYGLSMVDIHQQVDDVVTDSDSAVSKEEVLSVVLRKLFLQTSHLTNDQDTVLPRGTTLSTPNRKRKGDKQVEKKIQKSNKKSKSSKVVSPSNKDVLDAVEKLNINDEIGAGDSDSGEELGDVGFTKMKNIKRKSMGHLGKLSKESPKKKTKMDQLKSERKSLNRTR